MIEEHKVPIILPFSANSAENLQNKLNIFLRKVEAGEKINFASLISDLQNGGTEYRAVVIANSWEKVVEKIQSSKFLKGVKSDETKKKLGYVFTGHGSIYHGMGENLYTNSKAFQQRFDAIDYLIQKGGSECSFKQITYGNDKKKILETLNANTAIYIIEMCLAAVWKSWGLQPDVILGHSFGEYAAACTAGIFTEEDAAYVLSEFRGKFVTDVPPGAMMSLVLDRNETQRHLKKFQEMICSNDTNHWVEIAVTNSSCQTVVSGTPESIELFSKYCQNNGIKGSILPVCNAYHSKGIDPVVDEYRRVTGNVNYNKPKCDYFSSISGKRATSTDADFWTDHVRKECKYKEASIAAYKDGECQVFLEIGGQPFATALLMQNVMELDEEVDNLVCLPSLKKGKAEWDTMLNSAGKLYVLGYPIDWRMIYQDVGLLEGVDEKIHISSEFMVEDLAPNDFWRIVNSLDHAEKTRVFHDWVKRIVSTVLDIEIHKISISANLRELGLDSIQLIKIVCKVQKLFGKNRTLNINDFLDCPTIEEISARMLELMSSNNTEPSKTALKELIIEDAKLWEHINVAGNEEPVKLKDVKKLLITGATGNLAPYIIEWLSKHPPTEKVYCIVRKGKEASAHARLHKHLQEMGLYDKIDMSKIQVLDGNIVENYFGIDKDTYENLAWEIDAVIHCAVTSNHLVTYRKNHQNLNGVREVNVIGTQRVLEFAASRKTKWVYHASTFLALWGSLDKDYDKFPEEWPSVSDISEDMPDFGYGISKLIADILVKEALDRGIPCKSFRFPKINGDTRNGRQAVMKNHFFVKFLYYIISGYMPDIEIPLQLLPVDTCAELSMKVFLNEAAPCDIYNVLNPHAVMETQVADLVEEFGPQLRILWEAAKLGEGGAKEKWKALTKNGMLKSIAEEVEHLVEAEDIQAFFLNERVSNYIKSEFGYSMTFLSYDDFVKQLIKEGEDSVLFNWIDFYTGDDSLFKLGSEGKLPMQKSWAKNPKKFISNGKIESLYPDIKTMVENPMTTLRRDIQYTITNAKSIFLKS